MPIHNHRRRGHTKAEKAVIPLKDYSCQTRILSGAGAVSALGELKAQRLLVVTDPFFYKNGTAGQLARIAGAPYTEYFHEISPDPSAELAARGAAAVRQHKPDTVLALGGGSAMDCAKAMVYFSGVDCKLIAIPTTSGSGSEVTDFAILTHGGVKHPLVDAKLRPSMAIIDPDLVAALPTTLIADGGFDVLTHAVEAYGSKNANAFTDALAQDAFRTVLWELPRSFRGDLTARGAVHTAATAAGLAFTNAGLGLCHALSHSLGGQFHLPHGRLNAIILPVVLARCGSAKFPKLARLAGLEGQSDAVAMRNLLNALSRLRRELQLPATLAQAGISPAQVRQTADAIVEATLADPCQATDPLTVTPGLIRELLREVTGRG